MSVDLAALSAAKDDMTRLTMGVYFHDKRMQDAYKRLQKEQESCQLLQDEAVQLAQELSAATGLYIELSSKTTKV